MSDPIELKPEITIKDAIGRNIICEDGTSHRVVNICQSLRYADKCIINETDPDAEMGYFVHTLSLVWQLMGKGIPPKEAQEAATKVWRAIAFQSEAKSNPIDRLNRWRQRASGLVVPG